MAKEQSLRFVLLGRSELIEEPAYCAQLKEKNAIKQALIDHAQKQAEKITPKQIRQQLNAILSHREIQQAIESLKQLGSEVIYFPVDVTEETKLRAILNEVGQKKWGNIDGIIHAAEFWRINSSWKKPESSLVWCLIPKWLD